MSVTDTDLLALIVRYFETTPIDVMAVHALLAVMWFPVFAVLIHGLALLWLDYKGSKFGNSLKWMTLEVQVPPDAVQTPKGMENFFTNLAGCLSGPTWKEKWMDGKDFAVFSFELVSIGGDIHYYIRAQDKYKDIIEADLYAQYPEAVISVVPDWAEGLRTDFPNDEIDLFGSEYILKNKHYFPIRTFDDFEHQGEKDNRFKDPLLPVLEILGQLKPGEIMAIQILISGQDGKWVKDGLEFLGTIMGKVPKAPTPGMAEQVASTLAMLPLEVVQGLTGLNIGGTAEAPKKADDFRAFKLTQAEKIQIESVAEKISKVGWSAKIRWVGIGPKGKFRKGLFASGMKSIVQPFGSALLNGFSPHVKSIPKDDYFWQLWSYHARQERLAKRVKGRSLGEGATPCILNAEELATLWHFPAADARTPVLQQLGARRSEAPMTLRTTASDEALYNWKKANAPAGDGSEDWDDDILSHLPQAPTLPSPAAPEPLPEHADAPPPENLPL